MIKAFRILLIHPDGESSHACAQGLIEKGCQLAFAKNAEEATALYASFAPHLILTEELSAALSCDEIHEMIQSMLAQQSGPREDQIKTMLAESQKLARMGNWTVDLPSGKTRWSDGLFLLSGLEPGAAEPSLELALSMVHPDYREAYANAVKECIMTGQPFSLEFSALVQNGETLWASASGRAATDAEGRVIRLDGIVQDISERKAYEMRLEEEMKFSASLLENMPGIFIVFDREGKIQRWNRYMLEHSAFSADEITRKSVFDFFPPQDHDVIALEMQRVFEEKTREVPTAILARGGKYIPFQVNAARYDSLQGPMGIAIGFDRSLQDQAEQALKRQLNELRVLHEISALALEANDEDLLIGEATRLLSENIYMDHFGMIIRVHDSNMYRVHSSYTGLRSDAVKMEFTSETGIVGRCIREQKKLRIDDITLYPEYVHGSQTDMRSELCVPMIFGGEVIGVINAESRQMAAFSEVDERLIGTAATLLGVAIQKIRLYQAERQHWLEAEVQHEVSRALAMSLELNDVLDNLLIGLKKVIDYDSSAIFFLEGDLLRVVHGRGFPHAEEIIGMTIPANDPLSLFIEIRNAKKALIVEDAAADPRYKNYGELNYVRGWMGVPLIDQGQVFGYFTLDKKTPAYFTAEKASLASTFANHAASAIMKARLFSQTRQRLSQLQALHDIDQVITTSVDLRFIMNNFLSQVCTQLGVDAADILKLNKAGSHLDFLVSRGFRTRALQHTHLMLDQGYAGKAALERRVIHVPDLEDENNEFSRSFTFADEDFHSYYGVPLITKGEVKGVLEVFHRSTLQVDGDWLDFLHILSTQAAIAIENADLFENLQTTNLELTLAYDATLEGWARTLEMRDQETEGHSVRVTELTVQLARAMGIKADEMVHIRRGAMLHDIGKMSIPDAILQKPGPLNEAEWEIMRTHPVIAYRSLAQIPFLKSAMDIPYFHHEKWDGSGYPQGLAGANIPLSARIFAVVDVFDALSSDRPYRPPWQKERVLSYLRDQSGRHFDPAVVEAFLEMLRQQPNPDIAAEG